MTATNELHALHQTALNASNDTGRDVLFLRLGSVAISVPLRTTEPAVDLAEAVITGADDDKTRVLLMMACGRIVHALLPAAQRQAVEALASKVPNAPETA